MTTTITGCVITGRPVIRVDFNNLVRDGLVKSHVRRADAEIAEGSEVIAWDPYEPACSYVAEVVEVYASGRVDLRVDWTQRAGGVASSSIDAPIVRGCIFTS